MTASTEPTATLCDLPRADGSATFSQNGYTVIGSVNGPIEVGRRDELSEEAAVDVVVRPAAGVGGTRERHLESIIQSTLRQIILTRNFPRTLIQVVLQIINTPDDEYTRKKLNQASSNLPILPALLQTSVLALLSAATPLAITLTAALVLVNVDGPSSRIITNPTLAEIRQASSIHVLAFTSRRELILAESEGSFTMDEWDAVSDAARDVCCSTVGGVDDDEMVDEYSDEKESMTGFLRSTLREKVSSELEWRE